jgi:hypothetical protein
LEYLTSPEGLTHPVTAAALEIGPALERYVAQHPGAPVAHPWPRPLPASWTGQFQQRRVLPYTPVRPALGAGDPGAALVVNPPRERPNA